MIETSVFLFLGTLCALPSLISHKKEEGRNLLGKIIFVQGGIGLIIFIVTLIVVINLVITGAEAIIRDSGIVYWLTLFASQLVLLCLGFIISFGLVGKLVSLRGSPEANQRAQAFFYKLIELQTAAGFLCLVTGIWDIIYATAIYPVIHI
jgi:hypothetical protein